MCWIFTFWYSLWSVWLRLQTDVYSHSHGFASQAGDRWSKYPRLTHNRCRRIRPETGSHWRWITETSSLTTGSAIDMQQPNPRVFIAALIRAGMLRQRLINTALELNQVSWWWSLKRTAREKLQKQSGPTNSLHTSAFRNVWLSWFFSAASGERWPWLTNTEARFLITHPPGGCRCQKCSTQKQKHAIWQKMKEKQTLAAVKNNFWLKPLPDKKRF